MMCMTQSRRWILLVSVLFLALSAYFVFSLSETYADTTSYAVKVTSTTVTVRSGPSTSYASIGKLKHGQTVNVSAIVTKGTLKWYKFTYNAKTAYICSTYTKLLSKTQTYSPARVGKSLSSTCIRTGPSTSKPSIGTFRGGTQTNLYSLYTTSSATTYKNWYRVSYNGKVGYVIANFVAVQPTVVEYTKPQMGLSTTTTTYRASPSFSASILATLDKNSLVSASAIVTTYTTSTTYKWYRTTYNGTTAYVYTGYVRIVSSDDAVAFEAYMTAQGFPESYKPYLRELHADNPKWVFKAQLTGLDWSSALSKEQVVGRSLLSSGIAESWKSFENGSYDFVNNKYVGFDGTWNAADGRVVAYYFDPRNFLTQSTVFQYLDHCFDANSQSIETIRSIAAGTFLNATTDYATWIYNAGKATGVNPNVLTAMIRQEQGVNGSGSISGTYTGYTGLYNFYNISAYTTSSMTAIEHGLWWARGGDAPYATTYGRPWNTKEKAITGGAQYLATNYVLNKQNTLYLKKFNVLNGLTSVGTHQFMTHILGAYSEGVNLGKAYTNTDYPLVFCIPVFNNMPAAAVAQPGTTGNNDNVLNSLSVVGTTSGTQYPIVAATGTGGFSRYTTNYKVTVPSAVTNITVSAVAHNAAGAVVTGGGSIALKTGTNVINVVVRSTSGLYRTYTITVNRS